MQICYPLAESHYLTLLMPPQVNTQITGGVLRISVVIHHLKETNCEADSFQQVARQQYETSWGRQWVTRSFLNRQYTSRFFEKVGKNNKFSPDKHYLAVYCTYIVAFFI